MAAKNEPQDVEMEDVPEKREIPELNLKESKKKVWIFKMPNDLAQNILRCDPGIRLGMATEPRRHFFISSLDPGGAGARSGELELHDVIETVMDQPVRGRTKEDVENALVGPAGTFLRIGIIRKDAAGKFGAVTPVSIERKVDQREVGTMESVTEGGATGWKINVNKALVTGKMVSPVYHVKPVTDFAPMFVFSENEREPLVSDCAVKGAVDKRFDLQMDMKELFKMNREKTLASRPVAKATAREATAVTTNIFQPGQHRAREAAKKAEAQRRLDARKERGDAADVDAMILKMFEEKGNWLFKAIQDRTKQPQGFLKERVDRLCDYQKQGPLRSTYTLKERFQTPVMKAIFDQEERDREIKEAADRAEREARMAKQKEEADKRQALGMNARRAQNKYPY